MTKTQPPAAEAPVRTPARAVLAGAIATRTAAAAAIEDKKAALRRLHVIGETAGTLAAQLGAAKARDAQRLAEFALRGEGKPPVLNDVEREQLCARLAEAEAKTEAASPAIAIVEQELAQAHAAYQRADAGVRSVLLPVFEEERLALVAEVRALTERLIPLHARISGLRSYALIASAGKEDAERAPFLALLNATTEAMAALLISPQTPTQGREEGWRALGAALVENPDATVAFHAEGA